MGGKTWEKFGALGGIWFFALVFVTGFMGEEEPDDEAGGTAFAQFYAEHGDSVRLTEFIGLLGVLGILWWFGSVWAAMERTGERSTGLGAVALGGFLFGGTLITLSGLVSASTAAGIEYIGGDQAQFFDEMSTMLFYASSIGWAALTGAVSYLALRTGFLPRWLAVLGMVVVAVEVVASGGVAGENGVTGWAGFLGIMLWGVWVLATSIVLLKKPVDVRHEVLAMT